ncbi:hypothetical protein JIG36_34475 [Actinoplanes sp. LDG1-06]|uniref:Uncharacterized protein n=1 Tax=Paractinoplanes ovalisporus TaxID=2810368 RepID=A0ABS2ALA1_9ACTN|nr:hypothetical protein [Actinoplanes ovalisporus]
MHRSQCSQFDRVSLVLPPATSPLLTRELFYTAVLGPGAACASWVPRRPYGWPSRRPSPARVACFPRRSSVAGR